MRYQLPDPLLVTPYSIVKYPFPVPTITDICEGNQFRVSLPCALTPYILGALESWVWSDSFEGTPQQQEIAVGLFRDLQGVIAMASRNCDCDPDEVVKHRVNPDTGDLEQSTDDGATWKPDPASIYNRATQLPPLVGNDPDAKRCEAANNVIGAMKTIQVRWSGYIGTLNDFQDLLAHMLLDVLELLFIALEVDELLSINAQWAWKLYEEAKKFFRVTKAQYDAMFSVTVWDTVRCILLCEMNDSGQFNNASWARVKDRLPAECDFPPDSAGDTLAAMVDMMGLVGLNNAASIHEETQESCDGCACGDCSNLENWNVVYGSILFQEPGHLTINSGDAGSGNQAVRISNYTQGLSGGCCQISWDNHSSAITNQARYECGNANAIVGAIPQGSCGYDFAWTNVFGVGFTLDIYFLDCP